MGITRFRLFFEDDGGHLEFTNAQGDKELCFVLCRNVFSFFPQEGYSQEVGCIKTEGHYYRCATSAAWVEPKKLQIKSQIIDNYFGNLTITIGFQDTVAVIYMEKAAEDFLNEYSGYATAVIAAEGHLGV